jgi:hypothetical protein
MVFTQTLGVTDAKKLKKPHGKNVVRKQMKLNRDIKNAIDASVRAAKPKTNKLRDLARQRAITKAMSRNRAFRDVLRTELATLATRLG